MSWEAIKAGPTRPEDKGVCAGLTTLPVNKISYKSIHDNPEHSPEQERVSISETYDAVQWKPKGSWKADSPSDTQDNSESSHMENQDNELDRKNPPSCKRDENYKIGVLGLSETRWLQSEQLRFSSGKQLLNSGHIEDGVPHTEGVVLMLPPEAHGALIGWEPVNPHIITAKFTTKKKDIRLNIIQCYAPINDVEEEKKDDFYQQLQAVLDRRGAKNITILMGDFNVKIGMDNTGYEDIMETHGLGQINENGERFADLRALNQLVIGGSIFPYMRIHKGTWISPNHVTENQIDHICISRKFRTSWQDVRVLTCHQTTTFLWQQWDFASRDSPTPTAHGQDTMLDCSETRTHKLLSRSAFPTGSSHYKSW